MEISCGRIVLFSLILTFLGTAAYGQSSPLPRVGTIKNYEATGLMTGCNNLYSILPADGDRMSPRYVFVSREHGDNAWMNLNGRDIRLRKLRGFETTYPTPFRFHYRSGKTYIDVYFQPYTPRAGEDSDHMFGLTIKLRRGKKTRSFRALGHADC